MTIEELQVKKREVELEVRTILRNFEVSTKTLITDVEYTSKACNTFATFDFRMKIEL